MSRGGSHRACQPESAASWSNSGQAFQSLELPSEALDERISWGEYGAAHFLPDFLDADFGTTDCHSTSPDSPYYDHLTIRARNPGSDSVAHGLDRDFTRLIAGIPLLLISLVLHPRGSV